MTTERKAPYETPDAVISVGLHRHKSLAGSRTFLALNWVREKIGKKPLMQTFVVWIIYREWQEHTRIVTMPAGTIAGFVEKLLDAPTVRQVHVAELWFKGRKSFGVDYDPSKLMDFFAKSAARPLP